MHGIPPGRLKKNLSLFLIIIQSRVVEQAPFSAGIISATGAFQITVSEGHVSHYSENSWMSYLSVSVGPQELRAGLVYCQSVRPAQIITDENHPVGAIHSRPLQLSVLTPVTPVHVPEEEEER